LIISITELELSWQTLW